jgi:hypothetical protein
MLRGGISQLACGRAQLTPMPEVLVLLTGVLLQPQEPTILSGILIDLQSPSMMTLQTGTLRSGHIRTSLRAVRGIPKHRQHCHRRDAAIHDL